MSVRALLLLVEDEGHHFPLAIPSLTHGCYVDDIFGGADSTEQLTRIALQLRNICSTGGFLLNLTSIFSLKKLNIFSKI